MNLPTNYKVKFDDNPGGTAYQNIKIYLKVDVLYQTDLKAIRGLSYACIKWVIYFMVKNLKIVNHISG